MIAAFDKTGRQIKVGDVLKVYHFQGARWRKHYFMYKQVIGERDLTEWQARYLAAKLYRLSRRIRARREADAS